jgi:serine/threonine protein kinase
MDAGTLLAGRYLLVRLVGAGGMGQVWEAHDEKLHRSVAVKMITEFASGVSSSLRDRLKREAQSAAGLDSPYIATVYDYCDDSDVDYVVMELVAGTTLREVVEQGGPQPPEKVAQWGGQICQALGHVHHGGVYHRDLKPQNLMLTGDDTIKLIDFGLAAYADPGNHTRLTPPGVLLGTPAYMSPEQARGEAIDERSDLYSLGCVFYYLLTGRPPFMRDTSTDVLVAHMRDRARPPSTHRLGLDEGWDDLVLGLLVKNRDARRPGKALNVLESLSRLASGRGSGSTPRTSVSATALVRPYMERTVFGGTSASSL